MPALNKERRLLVLEMVKAMPNQQFTSSDIMHLFGSRTTALSFMYAMEREHLITKVKRCRRSGRGKCIPAVFALVNSAEEAIYNGLCFNITMLAEAMAGFTHEGAYRQEELAA